MRAEERDWQIYHLITAKSEISTDEICEVACTDTDTAEESLERLEKYHLISRKGEKCTAKSIQEILITAELKRAMNDSPIYMENGIIKVRKECEEE